MGEKDLIDGLVERNGMEITSDALLAMGRPPWKYVICRLMGEAQDRWGVCAEIPREEVVAWLSSRMTHWTKAWPNPIANESLTRGPEPSRPAASSQEARP